MSLDRKRSQTFFRAVRARDDDTVRAMLRESPALAREADPDCFNYRLLSFAAWLGRRELVDLALDHGAEIDAPSEFPAGDWTPLQHALNYDHPELAQYLVERGAKIDVHSAAGLPRKDLLAEMLDSDPARVLEPGGDGTHPLHFAADPEIAELLLDRGAEIDARDADHFSTPAQWAAVRRNPVSRYLVQRGAACDVFLVVLADDPEWLAGYLEEHPGSVHDRVDRKRFPPPADRDVDCIYTFSIGGNRRRCTPRRSAITPG